MGEDYTCCIANGHQIDEFLCIPANIEKSKTWAFVRDMRAEQRGRTSLRSVPNGRGSTHGKFPKTRLQMVQSVILELYLWIKGVRGSTPGNLTKKLIGNGAIRAILELVCDDFCCWFFCNPEQLRLFWSSWQLCYCVRALTCAHGIHYSFWKMTKSCHHYYNVYPYPMNFEFLVHVTMAYQISVNSWAWFCVRAYWSIISLKY